MLLAAKQQPQIYNKRHLVPFGEYFPFQKAFSWFYKQLHMPMSSLSAGKYSQPLLSYGSWKIAPYICYEIAYPEEVMQTMGDANLLLVISDDSWFGKGLASLQHLGIAQMRALETGRYVLFSNNSGPSALITPNGKIMAESRLHTQATVTASVEAIDGKTPFMRMGNWFILVWSLLALIASLILKIAQKRKKAADLTNK